MSEVTDEPQPSGSAIAYLPWATYLASIRADTDRLLAVSTDLDATVPTCPGWTVADLLGHLGDVFLHKVECMRRGAEPEPWPPPGRDTSDSRGLLTRAVDELLDELRSRDPAEERYTWWPPDQTNGFWHRRMALETSVHRVDGELAAGVRPLPVLEALALDGIDEVLRIMLDPDDPTEHPVDATVRVTSAGRTWEATLSRAAITVEEIPPEATPPEPGAVATEIAGPPGALFLWLWGRSSVDRLSVSGNTDVAAEFRARVADGEL